MKNYFTNYLKTPVGWLEIKTTTNELCEINFVKFSGDSTEYQPGILIQSKQQLKEYFSGHRKIFSLKINPEGTDFQKTVWKKVYEIPFGDTTSYLEIARQTGSEKNTRAVGMANSKNPIPIIIPCHRIIGTNKKLTGYAGGIENKRWLLQHEIKYSYKKDMLF